MFSCAVVIAVLVGVVGVGTASAGGSKTGQVCFKNQWQSLATASGATFASETACTSYVAKNATGALRASVDLRIETAPATCADVAVLYPPEPLDTTGVACAAQYVRLVNPGPFAVTVSGSFSGTCTATNLTAEDIATLTELPDRGRDHHDVVECLYRPAALWCWQEYSQTL